jgi:hypothetical protein
MQLLRLLSRVAFICNICFLLASFVQWLPNPPEGNLVSTIIVMGYFLAILVNATVNIWGLVLLSAHRLRSASVPPWLLAVNFIFFVIQLILIIGQLI